MIMDDLKLTSIDGSLLHQISPDSPLPGAFGQRIHHHSSAKRLHPLAISLFRGNH